jgi:hypothetical protein
MYYTTLTLFALAAQSSAACTRSVLQQTVTAYLAAQGAGDLDLLLRAKNITYTGNDVAVNITKRILGQATTIDLSSDETASICNRHTNDRLQRQDYSN